MRVLDGFDGYKPIDDCDLEFFRSVCGPGRVFVGDDIKEDYCHDEMPEYGKYAPEVVLEVGSAGEVSAIMRYCCDRNIAVTPRGSGTGLCGGAVAIHGGVMMSLAKMNKILEIDEQTLTVTVEAGVLLMELNDKLSGTGLMYPPDPGEKSATLGGNVMTNAGGMRAVKYGVTRDYCMGAEAVLPNGEIIELGGKIVKNSSGYSLLDLIIGSEGTLCVVTKLILRLVPAPQISISLLAPYLALEGCVDTVPEIFASRLVPTAIEFMQREVIDLADEYLGKAFPDKSAPCYLLMRFDGNSPAEIDSIFRQTADICLKNGALDVFISDTEDREEPIWKARGAFLEAIKSSTLSGMDECDVVVPRNKIAGFIRYTAQLQSKYSIRIRTFGHAGDGNIHVYACRDDMAFEAWESGVKGIMDDLYSKAADMGGQVSGEHGIGHGKKGFLRESLGVTVMGLMRAIKLAFDPKDILNPGKIM